MAAAGRSKRLLRTRSSRPGRSVKRQIPASSVLRARRPLERDVWAEVTQLGLAGQVEDKIKDIADAPDLVRDLATSLIHVASGGFSALADSETAGEASRGQMRIDTQ
jgi:hypothetical protein